MTVYSSPQSSEILLETTTDNTLYGTDGSDTIIATVNADMIYGGTSDYNPEDAIDGGKGADVIYKTSA